MKLLFQLEDQVHVFEIAEDLGIPDLKILKDSLFRFFESHPVFTILNIAPANLVATHAEIESTLAEIQTFASARGLHLVIARTPEEAVSSKQLVLEKALQKQVEVLRAKLDLHEKMRAQAEHLVAENNRLKSAVDAQVKQMKTLQDESNALNPLLEKLWSEK